MSDADDTPPKFLTDLLGWYAMTMLGLGARTGLLAALREGPGTVDDIASRAGVDRRNCLEWLRALTAADHVSVSGELFELSAETSAVFGPGFPVDASAIVGFVCGTSTVIGAVADAVQAGGGIEAAVYHAPYGEAVSKVNTPTYAMALVPEWIAGVPGMSQTLAAGGAVADLACGDGDAAALIGNAFPASRVIGYDLDPAAAARTGLPPNVEIRQGDVRALPDGEVFDLVICLDSMHHFGDPAPVIGRVRKILKPGGVFLIAESAMSGDLVTDAANPFLVIVASAGLLYCLQENLAAGGVGITGSDGPGWITDALAAAAFIDVRVTPSATGYNIITGTA